MNCREIFEKLNEIMPVSLAMDFDNSGTLCKLQGVPLYYGRQL